MVVYFIRESFLDIFQPWLGAPVPRCSSVPQATFLSLCNNSAWNKEGNRKQFNKKGSNKILETIIDRENVVNTKLFLHVINLLILNPLPIFQVKSWDCRYQKIQSESLNLSKDRSKKKGKKLGRRKSAKGTINNIKILFFNVKY